MEVDLRVKDKEIKEEYLKSIIGDLNRKMEELKNQKQKSQLEKERIRFLGKALAGKLREKKEINDKIQQQNQKQKKGKIIKKKMKKKKLYFNPFLIRKIFFKESMKI